MATSRDLLALNARSADSLAREQAQFEERVTQLSGFLKEAVQTALENEARSVSSEWIAQAQSVIQALGSNPEEVEAVEHEQELDDLRERLSTALDPASLQPSEQEVVAQTKLIARTVLDEWMTRLSRAHIEAPEEEKIQLNTDALPDDEALSDVLRNVEVYGASAEVVSATLLEYVRDVLIREQRFGISEDLYIIEDLTSHGYLLVVKGAEVAPVSISRQFETVIADFVFDIEMRGPRFLEAAFTMSYAQVADAVARASLSVRELDAEPPEWLTFGTVVLSGALASYPVALKRMQGAISTGLVQCARDPVFDRFTEHFALVADVEQAAVVQAFGIVAGAASAFTGASTRAYDVQPVWSQDLMKSVYCKLQEEMPMARGANVRLVIGNA